MYLCVRDDISWYLYLLYIHTYTCGGVVDVSTWSRFEVSNPCMLCQSNVVVSIQILRLSHSHPWFGDVQCIYGVQLIWNLWSLAQGTPKPLANPCRNATSIWYLEAPTLVFQLLEALQKRLIILSWPVCCCFKFVISCGLCDAFSTLWSTNIAMDSGR